jgi:predicted amidohydrolase YtcJ
MPEDLLFAAIPPPTKAQYAIAVKEAAAHCYAMGLTTIVDCGLNKKDADLIDALQKEGPA